MHFTIHIPVHHLLKLLTIAKLWTFEICSVWIKLYNNFL